MRGHVKYLYTDLIHQMWRKCSQSLHSEEASPRSGQSPLHSFLLWKQVVLVWDPWGCWACLWGNWGPLQLVFRVCLVAQASLDDLLAFLPWSFQFLCFCESLKDDKTCCLLGTDVLIFFFSQDIWRVFVRVSVKFEVKFKSLLESLVDYTVIDDIKAITFYNKHWEICNIIFSEG